MKEKDYMLLKEIEKRYGEAAIANPLKDWNEDKEEELKKEIQEKTLENYKNSKKKKEVIEREPTSGCQECGKILSPKFIDQIHIKKYGLCFGCYTKRHY